MKVFRYKFGVRKRLFQFPYVHLSGWMGALHENLEENKPEVLIFEHCFSPVKAHITEQKEAFIIQFSGATDPHTGKTETRGNPKYTLNHGVTDCTMPMNLQEQISYCTLFSTKGKFYS